MTEVRERLTAGTNELIACLGWCSRGWLMTAWEGYADSQHRCARAVPLSFAD
jgi:hypothetical protein